jgi:hypothetical protein
MFEYPLRPFSSSDFWKDLNISNVVGYYQQLIFLTDNNTQAFLFNPLLSSFVAAKNEFLIFLLLSHHFHYMGL